MKRMLGILLLLCPALLQAQTLVADKLLTDLSFCDARFFQTMKKIGTSLQKFGKVESRGNIAYWIVADREDDGKNIMTFSEPIEGKIPLLGYFDEIVDLQSMGHYYSWGVLAKGNPDSILEIIKPLVNDSGRLRRDGDVIVRSEIRDTSSPSANWTKNDELTSGIIPKKNTAERVFLVEAAGEKYPGFTRIGCSLQGNVSAEMLWTERPDIEIKAEHKNSPRTKQKLVPPFVVGDILIPYRNYDHDHKALLFGASQGYENTKWKVVAITEEYVRLELVEGEFKPSWANGESYEPGSFSTDFFSSTNYKKTFPDTGNLGQVFDEFRKGN